MLRVGPSAKVHPTVVLVIHIVKDDDKALGPFVFATAELTGIVIAVYDILLNAARGILMSSLVQHATLYLPVAIHAVHLFITLESGACVPCTIPHSTLLWRNLFHHLIFIRISLLHFQHLRAQMLWHELLHVVARSAHRTTAAEA